MSVTAVDNGLSSTVVPQQTTVSRHSRPQQIEQRDLTDSDHPIEPFKIREESTRPKCASNRLPMSADEC